MKKQENKKQIFRDLIEYVRKDAQKGLEAFYNHYGKIIESVSKTICHTEDKVEDAVNRTLTKVWRASQNIGEINNPEGWVYIVTSNCAKDVVIGSITLPLNENIVVGKDGIQEFLNECYFEDLIKDLNEEEQRIMILKYVAVCTFREIAEIIERPLPAITTTYYRALKKLKKEFGIDVKDKTC